MAHTVSVKVFRDLEQRMETQLDMIKFLWNLLDGNGLIDHSEWESCLTAMTVIGDEFTFNQNLFNDLVNGTV